MAGGADRAVEVESFPQRPVGRRRVANRDSQATAQLQDSRRQCATLYRSDQVLGAFESGLDLGAGDDAIRCQQGRRQSELRQRLVVEAATGAPQIDAFARRGHGRSEEHTSELQSLRHLVCRLLLEKKKKNNRKSKIEYIDTNY